MVGSLGPPAWPSWGPNMAGLAFSRAGGSWAGLGVEGVGWGTRLSEGGTLPDVVGIDAVGVTDGDHGHRGGGGSGSGGGAGGGGDSGGGGGGGVHLVGPCVLCVACAPMPGQARRSAT
jgi:hypothetical protein